MIKVTKSYELVTFLPLIFGVIFSIFLSKMLGTKVPVEARGQVITNIYITCSMIIPLAVILMGYSCTFSNELEKDIPLRFKLFGSKSSKISIIPLRFLK